LVLFNAPRLFADGATFNTRFIQLGIPNIVYTPVYEDVSAVGLAVLHCAGLCASDSSCHGFNFYTPADVTPPSCQLFTFGLSTQGSAGNDPSSLWKVYLKLQSREDDG
jgi:hypothetical protein